MNEKQYKGSIKILSDLIDLASECAEDNDQLDFRIEAAVVLISDAIEQYEKVKFPELDPKNMVAVIAEG